MCTEGLELHIIRAQMDQLMSLPDLDVLVAVVEAGSLTAAARKLDVPRPTVSRRLSRLEEQVGVKLVRRTTRQLTLTDEGMELYRHARSIVDAVQAATAAIRARDDVPRGLLRVSLPPGGTGERGFGSMVSEFLEAYPEVRLEVLATTRHVDLVAEGFDVAIRAGDVGQSSLMSRRVVGTSLVACASPAYLAREGKVQDVAELSHRDCLVFFDRGEVPMKRWPLRDGGSVPVQVRLACNDLHALSDAAQAGIGIAMLPETFVRQQFAAGTLTPVLRDVVGVKGAIWIVFSEKRLMLPRVRAFIDHVVDWIEGSFLA
jgi:DNA-binding transcriptional LysR family regulator